MSAAAPLRHYHALADALGRRGIALAATAGVLLVVAFAVAVATVSSLTRARPYESVTAELSGVLADVGGAGLALLSVVGTLDGDERREEMRERWRMASARIGEFCNGQERTDGVPRAMLCDRLLDSRALIERDLPGALARSPVELDHLTNNLTSLVRFLRAYGRAYREQSSQAYATVEEQRSLLLTLIIGTGGALAASFVLFYIVARAATDNRRRRLAAERSEREAVESRQQLLEAIEAIPMGFGLYDRDGRMVMYNTRLAELNPENYTPEIIGLHYEEILERLMARRPEGDRQQVHERLLARFRGPRPSALQPLPDGRIFVSHEVHTPRGYIVSCRVDITALKRREAELEASEARQRKIIDSMIDVVFMTGYTGVTYLSASIGRVLGVAPEQVIGAPFTELFHPDDLPLMKDALRATRRAPDAVQTVRLRGGSRLGFGRWVESRFTTFGPANEHGHYPLIGVMRDIHAEVLAEHKQREDMLKMRSIVESSGALIALVDGEQRLVLANRTFLDGAGASLDDAIGRRYEEVVDCGETGEALKAWLAGEQREAFAFDQVLGKGSQRRIVRVTASHVHDDDGKVNYSLFLGVDETDRRQAETRAIDASRLATLGEMATGMAHEINQPLTVIQFAVDAIAADIEDNLHRDDPEGYVEDAMRHVTRVRNQSQRAAAIVRRLQGFARRGDEVAQPFDIPEAIQVGVDLVAEQMRLARIAVELDLPLGLPHVHGHATRLQQVVINLMINARDAINEARGGAAPGPVRNDRIDIRAFHDSAGDRVVVEIGDSGPGIPEHVLPKLFESFFTTKPKGKGTGLGLSISTEIVGEMKGTIAVENQPQGGALFRLSFPSTAGGLSAAA